MADIKNKNELKRRIDLFLDELDYSINEDFCKETMNMMREFIGHASHRLDCENDKVKSLKKKLKDYRDLEEQSLLLRLPCAVGATVYRYVEKKGCVLEYTVWNISMSAYESGGIDIVIEGCAESEDEVEDEFSLSLIDFKNEFFNTREEAEDEQKLKEMERD